MPFADQFTNVLASINRAVSSAPWHMDCRRADFFRAGHILGDILAGIAGAELVVADLTGSNANVFYELGIVHMVREPDRVILITQDLEFVPFDLRGFRVIVYKPSPAGRRRLEAEIGTALDSIFESVYSFIAKQGERYHYTRRLKAEDGGALCDFVVFVGYGGLNDIKFEIEVTRHQANGVRTHLPGQSAYLSRGEHVRLKGLPWNLEFTRTEGENIHFRLRYSAAAVA